MNGERRRAGTNLFIVGTVIFLIGVYSRQLENWINNWNSNIRIVNWGWLLILSGGIIAAYGIMTLLDEYFLSVRPPVQPGIPQPLHPLQSFMMDRETRKMIWVVIIAGLVLFIISPGLLCPSMFYVILVLFIIFLVLGGGWRPHHPQQFIPPQPPQIKPPPPQSGKVTLCGTCYAQLDLDWVACPFCGQPVDRLPK